ncbi:MAG TPA: phosphotransferase [Candidatus Limnocylindria bacterium]|nr:phosphotransferase [Candidatus Limnocylindria bacterium]
MDWSEPQWRREVQAWIKDRLAELGERITGPIEQQHRVWWSTVLRIPTDAGDVWFKAVQPDGAFEMGLTPFLARLRPARTAEVIATDPDRGWMLSRDAGARLREFGDGRTPLEHFGELLPRYAELQIAVGGHRDELAALGVPDRTLDSVRADLRQAAEEPETLLLGQEVGLSTKDHRALVDGLDEFDGICERLAGFGLPDSIQHDDFHDGNVFVRDGEYVFFDWGDACISHPFHTLVVTLRSLTYGQKLDPGSKEILGLRDAYLEPWTAIAPRADVVAAADLARRTGVIGRAMAWRRFALAMPPEVRAENIDSVAYGIRLYLADGPWGSWDDGTF